MLKRAAKNMLHTMLRAYRDWKLNRRIFRRSNALLKSHPQWIGLTPQEKAQIRDKDYGQYAAYKNVYGKFEEGFVSDSLYLRILRILNSANYTSAGSDILAHNLFGNKNYFALLLKYLTLPKTVVMSINGELLNQDYQLITKESALDIMNAHSQLVFKPAAGTGHGTHVSLVDRKDFSAAMSQYVKYTEGGGGFIVQEVLRQHESFSRFNKSSVNVIRITTLFWKSELYILGAILRVGAPGQFCDHTTSQNNNHPRIIALDNEGRLTGKFIDPDLADVYDDCYGVPPEGVIPKFREMKELCLKEHMRFPHHRIIGWDITLDENENITCIEYNPGWPGIIQSQYVLGPVFMQKSSRGIPLLY